MLNEDKATMDVNITLQDVDNVATVTVHNTDNEKYVWITLMDKSIELSAKISIEEIKHALRKISVK